MGNLLHNYPDITLREHLPPLHEYVQAISTPEFSIWKHQTKPDSLIEYYNPFPKNSDMSMQLQYYKLRRNNNMLVSTKYLSIDASHKIMSIFYERVVTDLSKITDIPFKDTIKLYHTAFKGFQILYRQFGYFEVTEDLIFITQDRNVKVWCNANININFPSHSGHGTQQIMIKQILRIIESCTDPAERPQIPLNSLLYNEYCHTFQQVWEAFYSICHQNGIFVPHRLECLDVFDNENVLKMIDKYAMYGNSHLAEEGREHKNDRKQNKGLSLFQNYKELNVQIQHQRQSPSYNSPYKQLPSQKQNYINSPIRQKQNLKPSVSYTYAPSKIQNSNQPVVFNNKTFTRTGSQSSMNKSPTVYFNNQIQNFVSPPKSNQASQKPYSSNLSRNNPNQNSMNIVRHSRPVFREIQQFNRKGPHFPPKVPKAQIITNSKSQNGLLHAQKVSYYCRPNPQISPSQHSKQKTRPQSYSLEKPMKIIVERVRRDSNEDERRQTLVDKLSQFSQYCDSAERRKAYDEPRARKYPNPSKTNEYQNSNISNESSLFTRPQFWEKVLNVRDPIEKIRRRKIGTQMQYLQVPKNIDTPETTVQQTVNINKNKQRRENVKEQPLQFPSFTDISDNVSFIPTFEKIEGKNKVISSWREESAVISHDPNESIIKMPKQKKYEPKIDDQIMRDLKILREKRTVVV